MRSSPSGGTRKRTQAPPRRLRPGNLDGLAERRRDRESVQIDPERGVTDLSVVSSAEPGGDLHDLRPLRPDPDLRVGRPSRIPRARAAAPAAEAAGSGSAELGHACASATPNAGGSAVSRSVTVSGWNTPSTENALTVTSGPSANSSTSTASVRDASAACASAGASSSSL